MSIAGPVLVDPMDDPSVGEESDPRATGPAADRSEATDEASAPVVFLAGSLLCLGGAVAFVADLATGHGVGRSLALSAGGALVVVAWAAEHTLSSPDSTVDSIPGAAGTGALLYGGYLVVAGVVVAATSVWHGRFHLAVLLGGCAVATGLAGLLLFLATAFLGGADSDEADGQ